MKSRTVKIILLGVFLLAGWRTDAGAAGRYAMITLSGSVNPIIAEFIVKSIDDANRQKMQFIVIQLDTPGGLMNSMREIIKSILSSEIPVIVYTAPKGAQAASAGGYIMLSAHVAAMAPGTEIGAMHPVSPFLNFGQKDEKGKPLDNIMEKKVLNDTVAYGKSLAQKRKRNVGWTVRAIKDAVSSTYIEAYNAGVIDLIAEDTNDLLSKLNGRKVDVDGRVVTLNTIGATPAVFVMDWKQRMLNFVADPQIVFLLFVIAIAGIAIEIKSPGLIVPGVVGALSLLIFLMEVRVLPKNIAGLALIVLAIVLFVLELKVQSFGLLAIGGILSFVFGSMILFESPLPGGQVPMSSIVGVVIFLLAFFFVVVRAVIKVHRGQVTTGVEGLIGEKGVALRDFNKHGKVFVHGEIWNAVSDDEIHRDDAVTVTEVSGMVLTVRK